MAKRLFQVETSFGGPDVLDRWEYALGSGELPTVNGASVIRIVGIYTMRAIAGTLSDDELQHVANMEVGEIFCPGESRPPIERVR